LADKWEPTTYTVIDRNPQTHVYKVTDENGQTKVVHRTLMLDVSFLPVPDQTSSEPDHTIPDEASEMSSQSSDSLNSLEVEASEGHSSAWICASHDDGDGSSEGGNGSRKGDEISSFSLGGSDLPTHVETV